MSLWCASACKNRPMWRPKLTPHHGKIDPKSMQNRLWRFYCQFWKICRGELSTWRRTEPDFSANPSKTHETRTTNAASCPPQTDPKSIQNPINFSMLFKLVFSIDLQWFLEDKWTQVGSEIVQNRFHHRKMIFGKSIICSLGKTNILVVPGLEVGSNRR